MNAGFRDQSELYQNTSFLETCVGSLIDFLMKAY